MSEQKRATLSTISSQKSNVKKVKEVSKSIRFSLTLPESNEKACPEYNYRDLLNSVEKKRKLKEKVEPPPTNGLNILDPFDDNDDDVKRIARQFEEKYGLPKQAKRKGKKDDYADIGAGYDESDSFIDNTDAYDEMVPEDVTTLHGGFYINSGALEFKQVDLSGSDDSSDSDTPQKVVSRKRIIEDSEESESDEEENDDEAKTDKIEKTENPEKKQKIETNGVPKPAKKRLNIEDKDQVAKKKKLDENGKKKNITVKDLLREKREEVNLTLEAIELGVDKESNKLASSTINDVIESVVNAGRVENVDETSKDSSSSDDIAVVSAASSESDSSRDGAPSIKTTVPPTVPTDSENPTEPLKIENEAICKLPENLPNNVLEIINEIKKAAEHSAGKVKFFSGAVNTMFLNLEIQCRKLGKNPRLQIYEHLAPFVKCKKDTLMRRAKNLFIDEERNKMKEPLRKLKLVIENLMPKVVKNYEKELHKAQEEIYQTSTENTEANKLRKMPKKRFPWTEDARKLLQEIIVVKKKCYTLEGIRKESFEDHLETFLKVGVVCLWPEGWMPITTLMKHVKAIMDISVKPKTSIVPPLPNVPMPPITLDIIPPSVNTPLPLPPVKTMSLSPTSGHISGITVIPIPQTNRTSPPSISVSTNIPKTKHSSTSAKASEVNITVNKVADIAPVPVQNITVQNINEVKENSALLNNINVNKSSVTITSVDLRTNPHKDTKIIEKPISSEIASPIPVISEKIKSKPPEPIETIVKSDDDCQIIDLTEASSSTPVVRKPGPKSKTRYVEAGHVKPVKRNSETNIHRSVLKADETSVIQNKNDINVGAQTINQILSGLKYGTNLSELSKVYKEPQPPNEDDMEQVMKDLKELQQMQEHTNTRKGDVDILSPSSSPVSVIAYNSSFSPTKVQQPSDLTTTKERKLEGPGFQDIFQKHLYQDVSILKPTQPPSVYNSNIQPKNNYNSIDSYNYSKSGSVSNPFGNHRFPQSSSKFNASLNNIQSNPAGATNHSDDLALFSNLLYQYGYHNTSGSKQKSPP